MKKAFVVTMTLEVDDRSDDQLHTVSAIKDEVESWLDSLNAKVCYVTVVETTLPSESGR